MRKPSCQRTTAFGSASASATFVKLAEKRISLAVATELDARVHAGSRALEKLQAAVSPQASSIATAFAGVMAAMLRAAS